MPLPKALQDLLDQHGNLGWVSPQQRTNAQQVAHATADRRVIQYHGLPLPTLKSGQSVRLFDFWKAKEVVEDVGFVFDRIHQLTGSCVWAGGTNAMFTTIAAQRMASENPTKAFLPFTLGNYAMSRHAFGDDGQGEGSLGSTFAKSLTDDGLIEWVQTGSLPKYTREDGLSVTRQIELTWSSYRNPALRAVLDASKAHLLGSAALARSAADIRALNLNGYGVSFACNNYIGNASIQGSGDNARVIGRWEGRGGHQQSVLGVEEHPQFGPIYWAQNNWPGNTYPRDPGGGPVCGCWVLERDVEAALRLSAEVYGFSNQSWFPANPRILDWAQL